MTARAFSPPSDHPAATTKGQRHWWAGLAFGTALAMLAIPQSVQAGDRFATYANPVDLPYRYQDWRPFREAADPTVVRFKGRYWLFPSHSKGYWHSTDLQHWQFVEASGYAVGAYAPTVVAIHGKLYLAVSEGVPHIWVTDDPLSGRWSVAADIPKGYNDPCLFLDDDGRLYMYEGLSPKDPLDIFELDPTTFQPLRRVTVPASRDAADRGWENPGDANEKTKDPSYIEGSWMTKFRGRYYLQYAAAGTEHKVYADGVLVSDKPMGPFAYQNTNPFSVKPTGFATGAGHGSTFQGPDGRWWHIATMTISKRFIFERRLGLFPAVFTRAGELVADTYLGDYPHYFGGNRGLVGWMLLSRHKPVTVSSTLAGFPAANAVDEDIRTWWSARSGDPGEWLQIDLGAAKRIEAVQINFADQDSQGKGISQDGYRYVVEISEDGLAWKTVIDRAGAGRDAPHDYQVLRRSERGRYVRIRNSHSPDGGKFSLYDLRVFGNGDGSRPEAVGNVTAERDPADARRATIKWSPPQHAEFYIVRFGRRGGPQTQAYQVYDGQTSLTVASLTKGVDYEAQVDAVNDSGITRGSRSAQIRDGAP
ncbi:MAG: family 43 glycosylhydrolase [Novosphingobium sp.]|nr:family 43 glycosylhydrolase [Novosphingobium sp.]